MASSNVASARDAQQLNGRARITAATATIGAFLALEPLLRSLTWWNVPATSLHHYLHADTTWLLLVIIGLLGASTLVEAGEVALRRVWLVRLLLLWTAMAVLSSIFALVPALAATRSLRWVLGLTFALVLLVAIRRQPQGALPILFGWCAGFCAYAAVLLIFVITDPVREGTDWVGNLPGVANVRHLGFEAMAVALLGSLFRPVGADSRAIWLLRIAAIVGWAALFWSGGRGSFLAACATFGCIALLCASRPSRWAEIAMLASVGFALAMAHTPSGPSFGAWRTIGLETHLGSVDADDVNTVTSGRWTIWRESASVIAHNPLLGIGEAQTPLRVASARGYAQPHNLFLQAALAWGILGGAAFLFAVGNVLLRAARRARTASFDSPAIAGFAVMLGMAVNSMLDGTLFHPRPVTLFLIGSCLALGASIHPAPSASLHNRRR